MTNQLGYGISLRDFLASTSLVGTVGLLAPHVLFATQEVVTTNGQVEKARNEAASATITIQRPA